MARQRWKAVGRRHAVHRSIKLTPAATCAEFGRLPTRGTDHGFHAGSSRAIVVSCIEILPLLIVGRSGRPRETRFGMVSFWLRPSQTILVIHIRYCELTG